MKRKYLLLPLVALILALPGCRTITQPAAFTPSDLAGIAVSCTQIDLIWTDNSPDENGFYIYRRNNGSHRRIVALDPNTTTYSDLSLSPATTYWYKVTCYNDGGESNFSNEASAMTMVEVEILGYHMEKEHFWEHGWKTIIIGYVRNNTDQILIIGLTGEFYSDNDELIGIEHSWFIDVNPGTKRLFEISHWSGETEIEDVKVWIDEYY